MSKVGKWWNEGLLVGGDCGNKRRKGGKILRQVGRHVWEHPVFVWLWWTGMEDASDVPKCIYPTSALTDLPCLSGGCAGCWGAVGDGGGRVKMGGWRAGFGGEAGEVEIWERWGWCIGVMEDVRVPPPVLSLASGWAGTPCSFFFLSPARRDAASAFAAATSASAASLCTSGLAYVCVLCVDIS